MKIKKFSFCDSLLFLSHFRSFLLKFFAKKQKLRNFVFWEANLIFSKKLIIHSLGNEPAMMLRYVKDKICGALKLKEVSKTFWLHSSKGPTRQFNPNQSPYYLVNSNINMRTYVWVVCDCFGPSTTTLVN